MGLSILVGPSLPATADPMTSCSTTVGVIVVVDFSNWAGNIERGCDATLTNGWNALVEAGFAPTSVSEYQPGAFVCQIADPSTDVTEPPDAQCQSTPPATAYWSYWHADAGQNTWSYSQSGVLSYRPPPGSIEAWTFGGTSSQPPDLPPPGQLRATNTEPAATTSTPTTSAASPTTTAHAPPTTSLSTATGGTSTRGAPTTDGSSAANGSRSSEGISSYPKSSSRPAPKPHSAATASSTTSIRTNKTDASAAVDPPGSVPKIVNVASTPSRKPPSSGSPAPVLIGTALVLTLGGTGGIIAWRRRHAS